MADTQDNSQSPSPLSPPTRLRKSSRSPRGSEIQLATEKPLTSPRTDLTVARAARVAAQLDRRRDRATGRTDQRVDRPMEEFGLSSRDAVALGGDIEELIGVTLTATVVYQHPTIASLATVIIEGEPEIDGRAPVTRTCYAFGADAIARHRDRRHRHPVPRRREHAGRDVAGAARGPRRDHRPAGGPLGGVPRRARASPSAVAKANTRGGYLTDVKGFDAEFFALSPMEVDNVDPQQRMALELTWEALEHARIPASEPRGRAASVSSSAARRTTTSFSACQRPVASRTRTRSPARRRPSSPTGCRTSTTSADRRSRSTPRARVRSSRCTRRCARCASGEADVALVGGVNMLIAPLVTLGFDEVGGVLAPDGRIKSFSSDADGYVRSEGGGMRGAQASRRRPSATATRSSPSSRAARSTTTAGPTVCSAPNPDAQADVLRKAYRDAGINPRDVDYIEAHGTGTILGDPIEADALGRVVGRGRDGGQARAARCGEDPMSDTWSRQPARRAWPRSRWRCTNDKIPPSINYAGPNPYIDFDSVHLKVADTVTDWPRYSGHADHRCVRLRLRRHQRAPRAARGTALGSRRARTGTGARSRSRPTTRPTRCTSAGSGWTSTASSSTTTQRTQRTVRPSLPLTTRPNCPV